MTTEASSTAPTQVGWHDGDLVLTRTFRAKRDQVWRAWTHPEHFARWFGPHGSTMPHLEMDVRPGGTLHFCHRFTDYPDVWVRGVYEEVAPPERVAFTCWFSDPSGARVDRPNFPAEMRIAVAFAEAAEGTTVTVRQAGLVTDQGEVQGWKEGLDRFDALLAGA